MIMWHRFCTRNLEVAASPFLFDLWPGPAPKGSIDECIASEWLATSLVIIRTAALLITFSKKKAGAFAALGLLTYISEAQNDIFLKSF